MEVHRRRPEPHAPGIHEEGRASLDVSVFFPAYNEALNLERTVQDAFAALEGLPLRAFEVVIVDDGSTDGTGAIADALASSDSRVRAVHHPVNRGYGAALKSGFSSARLDWVFFSDSDGQFDLTELALLLPFAADSDAIIGYRTNRSDHAIRKINTLILTALVRAVFKLKVRDVDCAFKLLRRTSLEGLGPLGSDGAMISTELMVKLKRAGAEVTEVGVRHYPRTAGTPSGANPKVIARAVRELLALRRSLATTVATTGGAAHSVTHDEVPTLSSTASRDPGPSELG